MVVDECKKLDPTIVSKYLEAVAKIMAGEKLKYSSFEEFVLRNGRQFYFACPISKVGKPKECFKNAYLLAENKGLIYVEGYAITKGVPVPTLHAWCIDKNDAVYDPTWKDGIDYFGVPFDINYVRKTMLKTRVFGVIDNIKMGFPLLTGEHKDFAYKEETGSAILLIAKKGG